MSRVFTAHAPAGADPAATLLIEDRWRVGAFAFPLLWALWSRHWLVAIAALAVLAAQADLVAGGRPAVAALLGLGLRLALGFEGGAAARLDRRLRRWRELGAVLADDAEEAELRWFADGRARA